MTEDPTEQLEELAHVPHPSGIDHGPDQPGLDELDEQARIGAELATHDIGLGAPVELVQAELGQKSVVRRVVEASASLSVVVAMFALVIPRLFDTEYRQVFAELGKLDALTLAGLVIFWIFSMWTYWTFMTQGLPGLAVAQAAVMNLSGSSVSNVVPFGGAVGIGATYAQTLSWGFRPSDVTLSIIVTGVWNVFSKLGFPILALVAIVAYGKDDHGLAIAAWVGLAVLLAAIVIFALVMRSEALASTIGRTGEAALNRGARLVGRTPREGIEQRVLEFRQQSVGLVSKRWGRLTIWIALYKLTSFLLQLGCVRALGIDELGWVEVLAAYTFGELLTAIPITPSGVGLVEAGSAGIMIAFGAPTDPAFAAVFLFRAFTYVLEIPIGAIGWVAWATKRSWRRPVGTWPPLEPA